MSSISVCSIIRCWYGTSTPASHRTIGLTNNLKMILSKENGDSSTFRWRNVFSCINLFRILNKLDDERDLFFWNTFRLN